MNPSEIVPAQVIDYIDRLTNPEKRQYAKEVVELLRKPGRRIAYHAFCTDGAISAALLLYVKEGDILIPLDYFLLNDPIITPWLSNLQWYAIVDLRPFNTAYPADLFVDHHISVLGQPFNAKRVHFETGESGPSAATVLWKYLSSRVAMPIHLKILMEMSKITDTASYRTEASIVPFTKKRTILTDADIRTSLFDELIWDLQDALDIPNKSATRNNNLVELLAKDGLTSLFESEGIVERINEVRHERRAALNFTSKINSAPLVLILNPASRTIQDTIIHSLTETGTLVAIAIKQDPLLGYCTLSLRQSKKNTKDQKEFYRLDILAKKLSLGGGGHIEAAGGATRTLEEAFTIIKNWAEEKTLLYKVFDVSDFGNEIEGKK